MSGSTDRFQPQPNSSDLPPAAPANLLSAPKTLPQGWVVGSFSTYAQAQAAVDNLSDNAFMVGDLSIVGVDLMEVERVMGRLTWGRVLLSGAASGAWMGLMVGLLLGFFNQTWLLPLVAGVCLGSIFGILSSAVAYARSGGKRDFASRTELVARRYDIVCDPRSAEEARRRIESYIGTLH